MTNDILHPHSPDINAQPAETSAATEMNIQTLTAHSQDDIMNSPQPEKPSPTNTSSPRVHGNNETLLSDLRIAKNFIHTLMTLSQQFLTSLDKTEEMNTTQNTIQHKTNTKPANCHFQEMSYNQFLCNLLDIIKDLSLPHAKSYTPYPQSIHNHQQSLPEQIHILQQQVGKIYQLQKSRNGCQTNSNHKPETRTCYRCNTYGHIARNCRRAPINKTNRLTCKTTVQPTRLPQRHNTNQALLKNQVRHQQRDQNNFTKR